MHIVHEATTSRRRESCAGTLSTGTGSTSRKPSDDQVIVLDRYQYHKNEAGLNERAAKA